jgi:Tol biopolymer transport system component
MPTLCRALMLVALGSLLLTGCGSPAPTATSVPATATPIALAATRTWPPPTAPPTPPTATQIPPTVTPVPPTETATPLPSATPTAPEPTRTHGPTQSASPTPTLLVAAAQGEILVSIYPYGDISTLDAEGGIGQMWIDMPVNAGINDNRHARWLPDGRGISYTLDDFGQAEIWVMDSDGGAGRFLLGGVATDSSHAWSPDGKVMAYISTERRAALYHLADQTVTQLTDGRFRSEGDPDWSPDGSRIAFSATGGGNQDIYVIRVDGTDLIRVTNHPQADQHPDWSPDSTRIVFSSTRDGDHVKDLFLIDLTQGTEDDGNTPVQLTFEDTLDVDPDWSPDGSVLVYATHTFGASHATLFLTDATGRSRVQLTRENIYHSPQWRPR